MGLLRLVPIALLGAAVLASPAAAAGPERLLDVRDQLRDAAAARPTPALRHADARARALADAIGGRTVVGVDPLTRTVGRLQRLGGAMTAPSGAPPAAVARRFLDDHARDLGLGRAAVDRLDVARQQRSPSGLTVVTLRQHLDGVPVFDGDVRVGVDRAGRVLTLAGAPRNDLPADLPPATLSADDALAALLPGARPDPGDRRQLVVFGARAPHLAWHLTHREDGTHWWDAVVDARTGEVLYRANLVKAVDATVFQDYPGSAAGTTTVTLPVYAGASVMSGPYARAFADLNDNNKVDTGEETMPGDYPLTDYPGTGCAPATLCSWDGTSGTAAGNQDQSVVQTFWYVSNFHDHLASAPIGFGSADGNFEGAGDRVWINALDGAATGPDNDHLDNANMATPPAGQNPWMQMYLFSDATAASYPPGFRNVDGGDDAAVVYHEYTHGLSNRLITNADGTGALNSIQAGAMGEGLSDFYAMDFLARQGFVGDTAADGEVYLGRYTDLGVGGIRHEAMDCPVTSTDDTDCHNPATGGPGGFTYEQFGSIAGTPEVHADGEIWVQTLWQLREELVAAQGSEAAGSDTAERLVTDAMRLSPPEPSFLDLRNAILAADVNANGGANQALIWSVFAQRGMGYFAASTDGNDPSPVADFSTPPPPGAPHGAIGGTVTSAEAGLPLAGAKAQVGGLDTGVGGPSLTLEATSGRDGRYALADVPAGTYPRLIFTAPGYDRVVTSASVTGDATTPVDVALVRQWALASGGGAIGATNDETGAPYGCGTAAAIDGAQGVGWSAWNPSSNNPQRPATRTAPPTLTIALPAAVDIRRFAVDPGATCNDTSASATKDYKIETSPDGATWTLARQASFSSGDGGRMNDVLPTGPANAVRFVRLTLLSPQSGSSDYIDLSELAVYGNAVPTGSLSVSPGELTAGGTATLDASSFTDPDGRIADYGWDADGDGAIDRHTTTPQTAFAYGSSGTFTPRVTVVDSSGGRTTAAASLTVDPLAAPPPSPPASPSPPTPPAPPASAAKAKPRLTVPRTGRRWRVRLTITCRDRCRVAGSLTISARMRHRLHLPRRTVATLRPRTITATKHVTLTLTMATRRHLRRAHLRRLTVALSLRARVADGPSRTAHRRVRLRR